MYTTKIYKRYSPTIYLQFCSEFAAKIFYKTKPLGNAGTKQYMTVYIMYTVAPDPADSLQRATCKTRI